MEKPERARVPDLVTHFGAEDWGFNIDGDGMPGIGTFANAVQVWALCRHTATARDAAIAFQVRVELVRAAIDWHPFMYLSGDTIEHDGE